MSSNACVESFSQLVDRAHDVECEYFVHNTRARHTERDCNCPCRFYESVCNVYYINVHINTTFDEKRIFDG
jgi:hypothetical protein